MIRLDDPISSLKGVGAKKTSKFNKLGLYTVADLLYYFPTTYENRKNLKTLNKVRHNEKATIIGKVCGKIQEITTKNKRILKLPIQDNTGIGYVIFYNSSYLKKIFKNNEKYYFYGNINIINGEVQINHPKFRNIQKESIEDFCSLTPKYPLINGLSQNEIITLQKKLISEYRITIKEYLPSYILEKNKICDINYAIKNIHFPSSSRSLKVAKYRLVFEELFFLQFGLLMIKKNNIESNNGIKFDMFPQVQDLIDMLPFKLTNAQVNALNDIIKDMTSPKGMNRLIQGDVGSGKTIIALLAMYLSCLNGYQSTLMAPTEILAEQHFKTFENILKPLGIKVGVLTKSVKDRSKILEYIKRGKLDIIIGTHALIQDKVVFKNLGLVVTDEQHRFGVRQRSFLKQKGYNPDVLVMTATPIPRTLSLILYGDLDISIIDELPPGRKHVKTYHISPKETEKLYNFIKKEITKGRQAYIVCPLVEDSDKIDAQSAIDLYENLKDNYFNSNKLGLVHGKMNSEDKETIMKKFKSGEIEILITTTVIEVGVNVPNATIMVIQNAERFGLAQLHQLRGRVGRSSLQSYCFLISESNSKVTIERMKTMENTNNGFIIAEKDLKLRGPGDFFGTKQHGLPELKIADLFKHVNILKKSQEEALYIVKNFNKLNSNDKEALKLKTENLFGNIYNDFTI